MGQRISVIIAIVSGLILLFYIQKINAADIYIDPTYSGTNGSENGSFLRPYNSWTDVTITASNDYRQKCGTSETVYSSIRITNNGNSESDRIVIGAYYDDGGSPVLEDDNPGFGEFCGNGVPKPIIENNDFDNSVYNIDADYIELNSIQVKQGSTTIYIDGDYCVFKYCRIGWGGWGIRIGLSSSSQHNYVGYNYIYTDLGNDGPGGNVDGIKIQGNADYTIVEYNVIDGWDHACLATGGNNSYNEVRYNYILSWDDEASECMIMDGHHNNYHHNWCEDSGVYQIEGHHHKAWANVINNTVSTKSNHCAISLAPITRSVTDNIIANNIVYFDGSQGSQMRGIRTAVFCSSPGTPSCNSYVNGWVMERNQFLNNIVLNANTYSFHIRDTEGLVEADPNDPDVNVWRNNLAFGWTSTYMGQINDVDDGIINWTNADQFNNYGAAFNNRDDNPLLFNPANGEFWPQAGSPLIGNGYTLTSPLNQLLNPNSDFTGSPPLVNTITQAGYIGAYAQAGGPPINLAPIVNAGSDQTITSPAVAVLDGTVTDDGLPDPPAAVTTTWTKQSGPGTVTIADENEIDTTASFPAAGTYVLRLEADDSDLKVSDDITVTVNGDTSPPARPMGLVIIE